MRRALCLLLLALPVPGLADTIATTSRVTAVTVFPEGAEITREVVFTAPAGPSELLVTDMPAETEAQLIRLTGASQGLSTGAFALRDDRMVPSQPDLSPQAEAARQAVLAAEDGLQAAQGQVDAILARVEAAEAQAAFVAAARTGDQTPTPEALAALAGAVGQGVLAAKEAALAARAGLPAAERAVTKAQEALDQARAAEEALSRPAEDRATLSVAVTLQAAGEARLVLTHYIGTAGWQPVYDLRLTRAEGDRLVMARGVLVSQSTGEDWAGVALTLSTAAPQAQAEPSQLYPQLVQLYDPKAALAQRAAGGVMEDMVGAAPEPAMSMAEPEVASAEKAGDVVVYRYPSAVDVAAGVEDLRLALDEITLAPRIEARAVPRYDRTAFLLAHVTNTAPEPLLSGQAFLYREGVLVGATWLQAMAPGAEAELAFGAIDGLVLTREMPTRAEGDAGLLSSATERSEEAVMKVKNLTDQTWPVRLVDQVPYSEEDDLQVSYSADPPETEAGKDGQRGLLAWEFDLGPGEEKVVTLRHTLRWPEGMEVR